MRERLGELQVRYKAAKVELQQDDKLTADAKRQALRDLAKSHLAALQQLLDGLDVEARVCQEQIGDLEMQAPPSESMTEQQLLDERRQVDLLMSRLVAVGQQGFLQAIDEAATKQPGVFKVAFHQVQDLAAKIFPDAGSDEFGGAVDTGQDDRRRAFAFSALSGAYERAVKATITPAELQLRDLSAAFKTKLAKNIISTMHVKQAISLAEQDSAGFTFDDVAAQGLRE